jgi:tripeptide aminopeptidase
MFVKSSLLPSPPELPADFPKLLQEIVEIGSPTGREGARAAAIVNWFNHLRPGLARKDDLNNVLVDLSEGASGLWLFDAHIDTVFADKTLRLTKDGSVWRCPGIVDDTVSVVCLMLLARELLKRNDTWPLIFSFTVGEEGEGDLRGIRAVGAQLKDRLRGAWAVDYQLDYATSAAVGSKRWRVVWTGPGGHSWGKFGEPSAIHALGEWIASLTSAAEWQPFFLSYNVGLVSGGTTVNSLAETASGTLDLRSIDPKSLECASAAVLARARDIADRHSLKVAFESIGERPAGVVPADPPLFDWVREIHDSLGLPLNPIINSTNANALLALGVPAICTGLSRGGGNHTQGEWLDLSSIPVGWQKLWKMVERVLS